MKRNLVLLGICLLAVSFVGEAFGQKKKPRIGIAGIQIENSVFVPNRQPLVGHPVRMPDYLSPDSAMGQAATWLPTQIGYGGGRGPVTKESYDAFVEKTLEMIKANMPYDAFWFYNHGACSVEGVADPEGEFMEKVRSLIGNDVLTTTTMDLHGNTSWLVALNSDLITTYRQAPHADSRESHRRGVVNLLERLESGKGRPAYKAWVAVPVLVSGEWSSTRVEPAKSLYALVPEVEAMPGVIDAGIWIGYVWGDNPRNQGTVMVYGDDEEQVKAGAKKLAQKFWDVRKQFSLEAPGYSLEKCIDLAIASKKKPFFISDMGDVENLATSLHQIAENQKEAVCKSVNAGLDMHMYSADSARFVRPLVELVREKKVSPRRIDDAVRRILKIKFELGLFEKRYVSPEEDSYGSKENKALALEAAREAIVLLKNDRQILPLDRTKYKKILVTGPNADNQSILGDWSIFQPDDHVTTILEGIQAAASPEQSILYSNSGRIKAKKSELSVNTTDPAIQKKLITEGGGISDYSIDDAVRKARQSDLAIVAIGGYGIRSEWGLRTYGESADRPSIDFYGRQLELVQAIHATGTPVVIVIVNGKPLNNEWITKNIPTIVDVWEPGMYGGQALAEILFGEVNPSGKLPITIPKHAGQIPMYYYQRPSRYWTGYGLGSSREDEKPAFCFGHGLSYTSYEYSGLKIDSVIPQTQDIEFTFTVKNTGNMAGKETALVFIRDCVSSVVTPVACLKGFEKVSLNPGESKDIRIVIPYSDLGLWNEDMKYVVESGKFNLMIGRSVEDIRIKKDFFIK